MVEDNYDVSTGDESNAAECGMVEQMVAERHALFGNVEKAVRDEDDHPLDRGASGKNLRWHPVLGDEKLDKRLRNQVWEMAKKHRHALLEPEDVAQRIRLKIERGHDKYSHLTPGEWTKILNCIITNELARYAKIMECQCRERHNWISRDSHGEVDAEGEETSWRENLDAHACFEEFERDRRKMDVEEALAQMSPRNRNLIRRHFWGNEGLRTIAKSQGIAYSTFRDRDWKEAWEELLKISEKTSAHSVRTRGYPDSARTKATCSGVTSGQSVGAIRGHGGMKS